MTRRDGSKTIKAILTDVQFWVPAAVLLVGIALLVVLMSLAFYNDISRHLN